MKVPMTKYLGFLTWYIIICCWETTVPWNNSHLNAAKNDLSIIPFLPVTKTRYGLPVPVITLEDTKSSLVFPRSENIACNNDFVLLFWPYVCRETFYIWILPVMIFSVFSQAMETAGVFTLKLEWRHV